MLRSGSYMGGGARQATKGAGHHKAGQARQVGCKVSQTAAPVPPRSRGSMLTLFHSLLVVAACRPLAAPRRLAAAPPPAHTKPLQLVVAALLAALLLPPLLPLRAVCCAGAGAA